MPSSKSFNGSLRDELLQREIFDPWIDARRKAGVSGRYDYNKRSDATHSLGIPKHLLKRAVSRSNLSGTATIALPNNDDEEYENPKLQNSHYE